MKFQDYVYERPNLEEAKKQFETALASFSNATSVEAQDQAMKTINDLRLAYSTMESLCHIRHTIDTTNEFYLKEMEYFDEYSPSFSELDSKFYHALVNANFRTELEAKWGKLLFDMAAQKIKTFDPIIMEDLQKENKLVTEYRKLTASAKIEFEGEVRNLSQMTPFAQSIDRETRKKASAAVSGFFADNEEQLDRIYDELVKVRTQMAKKLGYDNYVQYGYDRLGRLDYGPKEVATYREQVYQDLVPVVNQLTDRKAERLDIKDIKSYDLNLEFLSGNPTPKGNKDWMVDKAVKMYSEMSQETKEFIEFMTSRELLDLEAKKGKAGGGYCTYLPNYKSPFIFSNFNGTAGDVDVLTHEAGHAFQVFSSRGYEVPEYIWPTYEACEIHSMSMEFFAWPWIHLFFEQDTPKYKYSHLAKAIAFIPYGVAVDEFQHIVYENPELTPAQRKEAWRNLEKKYLPFKVYDEDPFLERGGFWFRQSHIFGTPFYYIDYTLAQVCAFQYWIRAQENHAKAWDSYVKLCQTGGSQSFVSLLGVAELNNPFVKGTIKTVMKPLAAYLDSVDDKAF